MGKIRNIIKNATRLATAPITVPYNRLFSYAFYNDKFSPPGDYKTLDAENSAIVGGSVKWLTRALEGVPLRFYVDGSENYLEDHLLYDIFKMPNRRHDYSNFLWQNVDSIITSGNCIIQVLGTDKRSTGMQVIPWDTLYSQLPNRPGDPVKYRTFTFSYAGQEIPYQDVAHLIWQPHKRNAYIGESPLVPAYPELLLDKYAREATAGRLQSPVVGIALQPKEVDGAILPESDKKELEGELAKLRGTMAGSTFLGEARYDIKELQGVAHKFDYSLIYALCESRIAAQLGVPPAVSQMGVGLAQTRVGATMQEEVRQAYINGAIPLARKLESGWNTHLLPKLGYPELRAKFDFDGISFASEEEKKSKTERLLLIYDKVEDEGMRKLILEQLEASID